ncbi:hypothetical protein PR048_007104 [Dryococelus australis]|uniref:HTH CENPB-type domain-containing protein n=1 Tax=Dryococelus australis TaxID=614101 RepID=A0ABQ9ICP9_9NEOP|nr:hypothetical protein PR048_007104 [Dryococelus australis]
MATKRNRTEISLDTKMKIIAAVCREKIEEACASGMVQSKKRMRSGKYTQLESQLLEWFHQMHAAEVPLSGTIIQQNAGYPSLLRKLDDFKSSNGWLQCFK